MTRLAVGMAAFFSLLNSLFVRRGGSGREAPREGSNNFHGIFPTALAFCLIFFAASFAFAQDNLNGPRLAQQISSGAPDENSEIHGTIRIHAGDFRTNIPVVCKVEIAGNSWRTVYVAGSQILIVVHSTNGPNQYFTVANSNQTNAIASADTDIPLAGSDFSLTDLGLDFLHWPTQVEQKGEMRLGQPCYVLDSINGRSDGIVRIRCYIDKQSGGIILADAYNAAGDVLKEFSLHGSSFKKVNGQWRLEHMEMSDHRKHSQTVIQFDIGQ
jgi:hypothetical protein